MLDRQYQNDLNYLQARHQERIQAANEVHLHTQGQPSALKMKDRIYLALGERLIALGQKLKDEAVFNELAEECCA
jgi:hypothetical protein